MNKLTTILTFLTFIPFSFSQIKFEPGYYIDNSGNRIECLIKNEDWLFNPTEITIRKNEDAENQVIYTSHISEFKVNNGSKFIKETVEIDRSLNDDGLKLTTNPEPEFSTETLMLKVLIDGEIDLLEYVDNQLRRYFYKTTDNITTQFIYKRYQKSGIIYENNKFRRQLTDILNPNEKLSDRIRNAKYKKNDFIKVFKEYYTNQNKEFSSIEETSSNNKFKFNLGARVGYRMGDFTSDSYYSDKQTEGGKYSMETSNVSFGLEFEIIFPFNNGKWSAFIEPTYQSLKQNKTVEYKTMYSYLGDEIELKYNSIEIPIGIRHYMFLAKDVSLFLNLGYSTNLNLDSQFSLLDKGVEKESFDLSTGGSAFFGGGVSYKNFNVNIRYNTKRELSRQLQFWESKFSSLSFGVGYNFL